MSSNKKRKCDDVIQNENNQKKTRLSENLDLINKVDESDVERLDSPEKSENDRNQYRAIKLKNGLIAVLISNDEKDENENDTDEFNVKKTAVCALSVGVGTFSDPRKIQGLAHLVGKSSNFYRL